MEYSKLNGETSCSSKPTLNKQLGNGETFHEGIALYIKFVPLSFTAESFEALLSKFGKILSVYMGKPNQKYVNSQKVFSIVKVSSMRDALSIMENVHRKPPLYLSVEFAKTGEKKPFDAPKLNPMSTTCWKESLDSNTIKQLQNNVEEPRLLQEKEKNDALKPRYNGDMERKTPPRKCKCIKCDDIGLKRCSVCKAWYCSKECQLDDWYFHQQRCRPPPPLEDVCDFETIVKEEIVKKNSVEVIITDKKDNEDIIDGCDPSDSEHFALTRLMKKKEGYSLSQEANGQQIYTNIANNPIPCLRKSYDKQKTINDSSPFSQQIDVTSPDRVSVDQNSCSSKQVEEKIHHKKVSFPADLKLTETRPFVLGSPNEQKVTPHPAKKESLVIPLNARVDSQLFERNKVEKQRERFMKKELYIDNIEVGETYTILPTCIEGDTLFVQLQGKGDLLEEMVINLLQYCRDAVVPDALMKGEIICAYYPGTNLWYRAEVMELNDDAVLVHFIDFGNTNRIPIKDTRVCDPKVIKIPIFAIPVKPVGDCNAKEREDIIDALIEELTLVLMEVNGLDPDTEVELWNIEKTKKILPESPSRKAEGEHGESIALKLLQSGKVKPQVSMYDECKSTFMPLEKNVEVVVLQPTNPLCCFLVPKDSIQLYEDLEILSVQMNEYCNSISLTHYEPKEGEICLSKYSTDGLWYRACCVTEHHDSSDMMFVDYGNQEKVLFKNMCQMVDRFLEIPLLALHCQIKGFTKEDIQTGGTRLEQIFQEFLPPNSVQLVNVLSKCEDSHVYQIEIPTLGIEDLKRAVFS